MERKHSFGERLIWYNLTLHCVGSRNFKLFHLFCDIFYITNIEYCNRFIFWCPLFYFQFWERKKFPHIQSITWKPLISYLRRRDTWIGCYSPYYCYSKIAGARDEKTPSHHTHYATHSWKRQGCFLWSYIHQNPLESSLCC